jgi:hypothetical protein
MLMRKNEVLYGKSKKIKEEEYRKGKLSKKR